MEEMPAGVYSDWKMFFKEEPFGNPWENWLMAVNTNMISSANFKKSDRPKFSDYFYEDPDHKKERNTNEFFMFLESKARH